MPDAFDFHLHGGQGGGCRTSMRARGRRTHGVDGHGGFQVRDGRVGAQPMVPAAGGLRGGAVGSTSLAWRMKGSAPTASMPFPRPPAERLLLPSERRRP